MYLFDAKNGPRASGTKNQGRRGGYESIEDDGGTFVGPKAATAGLENATFGPTRVGIQGYGGYPYRC